ncbi:RNA methyltransferase, TrmH family [Alkalithermobacter thermoalcaliphilus JW-YL-7 = DSM 7308]|uniref:RNA methyltransferase, TrmH family n=1 Tax=Alkalithermobacter thermoalcaliphilus JW-YL-7 = DSM 7308 TaxID=1121328 RepID=A0A150FP69_CLOPD|nr:RNA methyltransferase, TrmH family, group 3 [[Clostridium] paradoxum JW-YL-7 = DSM 7308]SHK55467.1 RNA methyltransferase, TrmH family [[Clostridium] paradoxum JW-YL-7 = DSM 7308]
MVVNITSKENEKIKYIKSLLKKKNRVKEKKYIIEGYRIVKDAFYKSVAIDCVVLSDNFDQKYSDFIEEIKNKNVSIYMVSDKLFKEISDTDNPQGILAVVKYEIKNLRKIISSKDLNFVLILDRIQDPGNMGTIIRTADAAGVDAIVLLKGCVDIYNPKVIRSTMGSIFNTNIIESEDEGVLTYIKENGFKIISSTLNTNNYYNKIDYKGKIALVVGNEANGVSKEIIDLSDELVKIPIYGQAESLNAAIASALLMYEIKNSLYCK